MIEMMSTPTEDRPSAGETMNQQIYHSPLAEDGQEEPVRPAEPAAPGLNGRNPLRPDGLIGRKLPAHSLWEQLQRQGLALEFCSQFFNGRMSYAQAREWLAEYGIKISLNSLGGFYNSLDMQQRYAALEAAQWQERSKNQSFEEMEEATRRRVAEIRCQLAFMPLGIEQQFKLIRLQQHEDALKGNLEIKKQLLALKQAEFALKSDLKKQEFALKQDEFALKRGRLALEAHRVQLAGGPMLTEILPASAGKVPTPPETDPVSTDGPLRETEVASQAMPPAPDEIPGRQETTAQSVRPHSQSQHITTFPNPLQPSVTEVGMPGEGRRLPGSLLTEAVPRLPEGCHPADTFFALPSDGAGVGVGVGFPSLNWLVPEGGGGRDERGAGPSGENPRRNWRFLYPMAGSGGGV